MRSLAQQFGKTRVDMCAYGLQAPGDKDFMLKPTSLVLSNPKQKELCKRCPGHVQHQVIEGTVSGGQSRSTLAGKYPTRFVQTFLQPIVARRTECLYTLLQDHEAVDLSAYECLAGSNAAAEPTADAPAAPAPEAPENLDPEHPDIAPGSALDSVGSALRKLHNNLGHPPGNTLLRVLRNSGASAEALKRASEFQCPTREASRRPADAVPAVPIRQEQFNDRVGIDVKYLDGWNPNQKVPCLNIIDYGSSFQQMLPLPAKETGEMLRRYYREYWLSWAGILQELVLDPSQANLIEALCKSCEDEGTKVRHTAADAHWQLGKVERHGGLFAALFAKVLAEVAPATQAEWQECVTQTTVAKNSMLNVSGVSPYQFVFGRNPRVPADLLQDNPCPVAADAILAEPALDAQARVRLAARQAVVASQDCRVMRQVVRARPRLRRDFESGQWVAYWRSQKFERGKVVRGCRWYGPALVLGKVGRNVVVAHRRSIISAPQNK